ncbi:MAG: alpha/beta fold hydrolase [Planctomycetes bacterium]|nr:alpha/beta fold hydrolase [Planctomycetota bacterium]
MARFLISTVLLTLGPLAAGPPADILTFRIPTEDGRLQLREVLESMYRAAGVAPGDRFEDLGWSIDVSTTLGRLQMKVFDRIAPDAITTRFEPDGVIVRIDREALASQVEAVFDRMQQWVDEARAVAGDARFGITVVTRDDPRAPLEVLPAGVGRVVVIVHGLDDPGWMWRDMAPALLDAGHVVVRFEYPNDQAVADSTDLMAMEFASLRARGVRQADIVAHSMGGLVARDLLTRKAYYHGDGTGGDRFPAVGRLVMIGTPNHGAPMARLRGVAEASELISRWISGRGGWLDALADGAGEAGRDLLPRSEFLRRLNDRPHPEGTAYTIVAGRVSPVSREEVQRILDRLQRLAGDGAPVGLTGVSRALQAMVNGLGDGLVSINSARLEGVTDMVMVEADHMGLIVNVLPSDRRPPAIAIVLDRLAATQ